MVVRLFPKDEELNEEEYSNTTESFLISFTLNAMRLWLSRISQMNSESYSKNISDSYFIPFGSIIVAPQSSLGSDKDRSVIHDQVNDFLIQQFLDAIPVLVLGVFGGGRRVCFEGNPRHPWKGQNEQNGQNGFQHGSR
jgi:hypothetical protein